MKTSGSSTNFAIALLALILVASSSAIDGSRSSTDYTVRADTTDGGGSRTASANYTMDGSIGSITGISTAGSPTEIAKAGYVGQLTEVVSLTVTGTPATINQGTTSQLSGSATMNDATVTLLAGSDIVWSPVTYPFQSLNSNGVLTAAANVYAAPVGGVNGSYLGAHSNANLQVLGPYANAGIPDSWLSQYFGMPPNPNAAATVDADGTGQNNLFKYIAGLDPTNPASIFMLTITPVSNQPSQKNLTYNPIATGRTYEIESSTNLVNAGYVTLSNSTGPTTNASQVTVTDLDAGLPQKFYHVRISLP